MEKLGGGEVRLTISFKLEEPFEFRIYDSSGDEIQPDGKRSEGGEEIFDTSIRISAYRITGDCCEVEIPPNYCLKFRCSTGEYLGRCPC